MQNTFKIYDKDNKVVGCVLAKSEGHAKNKAVEKKLIAGKKQISKVELIPYDDPYEQGWADVYG